MLLFVAAHFARHVFAYVPWEANYDLKPFPPHVKLWDYGLVILKLFQDAYISEIISHVWHS